MVGATRVYLDASALVKLIQSEPETPALTAYLAGSPTVFSSRVAQVEVRRAVAWIAEPADDAQVEGLFNGVQLIELDATVALNAGSVAPTVLRSLDAIHLASALTLGDELDAMVTYDNRLANASRAAGLEVVAPA